MKKLSKEEMKKIIGGTATEPVSGLDPGGDNNSELCLGCTTNSDCRAVGKGDCNWYGDCNGGVYCCTGWTSCS